MGLQTGNSNRREIAMTETQKILMERDGMDEAEALELMEATRSEIYDAVSCGDFDLAEDLLMGDLGLEMDYIFDLI